MSYDIEIIKKEQFQISEWSGGTTIQLLIYPKESLYNERNFKWRLSSATVDVDESIFTSLPGISRIIMVIEGKLRLEHENQYNIELDEFEQDSFSGEWKTKSFGKVKDFNLMMNEGCIGNLNVISVDKDESKEIFFENGIDDIEKFSKIADVLYCVDGDTEIFVQFDKKLKISKGDILLITRTSKEKNFSMNFRSKEKIKVIRSTIYY